MILLLRQLAEQTLNGSRVGPSRSCFGTNDAGIKLANCGVDALQVIENVLESEVISMLNGNDISAQLSQYVGLNYSIGAYLVIAVRANSERALEFIGKQPTGVQDEAINCSPTFFFKTVDGYNFGVAHNSQLLNFLETRAQSSNLELASLAADIHEELTASLEEAKGDEED